MKWFPQPWSVSSPLRYCGGKSKVAHLLRYYRPLGCREYREPFCGGASLFFEVGFKFEQAWLNDLHPGLIAFFTALRDRPEEFIAACRAIEPHVPTIHFRRVGHVAVRQRTAVLRPSLTSSS